MRRCLCLVLFVGALGAHAQSAVDLLNAGAYGEARAAFADSLNGVGIEGYFETYLQTGAIEAGLRRATQLAGARPMDPYVQYALGRLHAEVGALASAEAAFLRAIQIKNDYWRAGLELADLYRFRGAEREAERLYTVINRRMRQGGFTNAADLATGARAAMRLEAFHDANDALSTALRLEPGNVQLLIWYGDLYAATYDRAFAEAQYDKARETNPDRADIYVRLAQVSSGFARREALAEAALKRIPGYAPALSILAELQLLDGQYAAAADLADQALEYNPSWLEAHGHAYAARYLSADHAAAAEIEAAALSVTGAAALFYRTASEDLALRYRYPAALRMAQAATEASPEDAVANALLGTALMRMGRNDAARRHLEHSHNRDAFNLFVANQLSLLDALDGFAILQSPHFTLRIHLDERDVLGHAMLREAERAYASLSERYPYQPAERIRLEAYHDADDFSVRVAGVPHIGLLGVCFGDVVALNTPRAQTGTPYSWARTLWHEIAHTMAIGVSKHHVPRWLTEGLSVYEEQRADPAWEREYELRFFTAFDQGRLSPLEDIDRGFTRPAFPGQVMLSYYHAYRVVDYLVDQFGFDALVHVLQALGEGLQTEAAIERVLGQSLAELDRGFTAHLRAERERLDPVMRGWPDMLTEETHGELRDYLAARGESTFYDKLADAEAALAGNDRIKGERLYQEALAIYDDYTGPGNPYEGLAAVYREAGDTQALAAILQSYLETTPFGARAARELADLHAMHGDANAELISLERARRDDPYDRVILERMAERYSTQDRHRDAVELRRAILALNPPNRAEAHYALAKSLFHSNQLGEARRATLHSLEMAPGFRDAQRLLLRLTDGND